MSLLKERTVKNTMAVIVCAALASNAAAQTPVNAFAASRGAVIVSSSGINGPSRVNDGSVNEETGTAFGGFPFLNAVVTLRTATPVTAGSLRFLGGNDGAGNGFRRAANELIVEADFNDDGIFDVAYSTAINPDYSQEPSNQAIGDNLDLVFGFQETTARTWRITLVPATSDGPRIRELELNGVFQLPTSRDGIYEIADVGLGAQDVGGENTGFFMARPVAFDGNPDTFILGGGTFANEVNSLQIQPVSTATVSAMRYRGFRTQAAFQSNTLTNVALRADTDGDGVYETLIVSQPVNPDFAFEPQNRAPGNELDLLFTFPPVTAQAFRIEATPIQFVGVLIREIDLFGTLAPAPCPADFNNDGSIGDIFDLFDFLAALDAGCP